MDRKPTLAIVEDDEILVFLYREVCKAAGWDVIAEASSGTAAFAVLDKIQPDLLLLDCTLADGQDGVEVLQGVREKWPDIRIAMITGWKPEALEARIDFVEPDALLTKPVMPSVLTNHLATWEGELACSSIVAVAA